VRAFIDLHCHTSASFDCLASPASVVKAAAGRGLTHLAITDHDTIEGALRARDAAPDGLIVIIGEEVKTADGDLIALFLERAVAPHRPAAETIAEVRAQGGLVGIPHPFDKHRGSMLNDPRLEALGRQVDWVEAHNARVIGRSGNEQAAAFATALGLPGAALGKHVTRFRLDDQPCRFLLQRGPAEDVTAFGWKVTSHEAFDEILSRVTARGLPVSEGTPMWGTTRHSGCSAAVLRLRTFGNLNPGTYAAPESPRPCEA